MLKTPRTLTKNRNYVKNILRCTAQIYARFLLASGNWHGQRLRFPAGRFSPHTAQGRSILPAEVVLEPVGEARRERAWPTSLRGRIQRGPGLCPISFPSSTVRPTAPPIGRPGAPAKVAVIVPPILTAPAAKFPRLLSPHTLPKVWAVAFTAFKAMD